MRLLPAHERTTASRVLLGVLFAIAFPAVCVSQLIVWCSMGQSEERTVIALPVMLLSPVAGIWFGWPYVVPACCTWAVVDQFNWHHKWVAALIGVAAGLAVALTWPNFSEIQTVALPVCATIGLVSALGVWQIAYGRQERIPKPFVTRPPLSL